MISLKIFDDNKVLGLVASKTQKNPQAQQEFARFGLSGNQVLYVENLSLGYTANTVCSLRRCEMYLSLLRTFISTIVVYGMGGAV
jgi:hypothetical protein